MNALNTGSDDKIDLYFWPTPNGYKALIAMEELQIPFNLHSLNITSGEQLTKPYREISPFGLIPAIVDNPNSSQEVKVFESGAILNYLAEKYNALLPKKQKWQATSWVFWQVSGLGPAAGQNHHFHNSAPENVEEAKTMYKNETIRHFKVLDTHLKNQKSGFIADEYSIADIACYPWINIYSKQGFSNLDDYPSLNNWYNTIKERPAVIKAYNQAN